MLGRDLKQQNVNVFGTTNCVPGEDGKHEDRLNTTDICHCQMSNVNNRRLSLSSQSGSRRQSLPGESRDNFTTRVKRERGYQTSVSKVPVPREAPPIRAALSEVRLPVPAPALAPRLRAPSLLKASNSKTSLLRCTDPIRDTERCKAKRTFEASEQGDNDVTEETSTKKPRMNESVFAGWTKGQRARLTT